MSKIKKIIEELPGEFSNMWGLGIAIASLALGACLLVLIPICIPLCIIGILPWAIIFIILSVSIFIFILLLCFCFFFTLLLLIVTD